MVLKVTKSKNREAIKEQRILNQINHPNIVFSYGLIYPKDFKKVDFKTLEKFLPKRNQRNMKSVDKLMKKNKYGELEYPMFEKSKSPMLKHYKDIDGARKSGLKMGVSPNNLRMAPRKKFNFSQTFKEFDKTKPKPEDIEKKVEKPSKEISVSKTSRNTSRFRERVLRGRKQSRFAKQHKMKQANKFNNTLNFKFNSNNIQKKGEEDCVAKTTHLGEIRRQMNSNKYKIGESHYRGVSRKKKGPSQVSVSRKPEDKADTIPYKKMRIWKLDIIESLDLSEYEDRLAKGKFLPHLYKNKEITYETIKEYLEVLKNNNFAMLVEYCGERNLEGK